MARSKQASTTQTNENGHANEKEHANGKVETVASAEVMRLEARYGAHNYHPLPVVFSRASGAHVWDPEGRRYTDMLSAYSAVNQGHCHPRIVAALVKQASTLTLSSRAFYNDVLGRFSEKVVTVVGGAINSRLPEGKSGDGRAGGLEPLDMILPMNTGVEAVETAIKVARRWGYVKKGVKDGEAMVLGVEGNFHGRTLGVVSMSTDPDCRVGFGPYVPGIGPSFYDTEAKEEKVIRYGHAEDLERALKLYGERVVGFLVEPIQGEAGIVVPPVGYLARVAQLCRKHNVLFICDEIQTGLARTGRMLACEWEMEASDEPWRPDIITLGKALSGGVYPVSCVLAPRDVLLTIKAGEHGSTYGGNPLGGAVAMAALDVIQDEQLVSRAERLGEIFRTKVAEQGMSVRGRGLLNAVVFREGEKKRSAWQFCLLLKSRGVLAKPTHVNIVRFAPPLVIEEADLLDAVRVIGECYRDLDVLESIPGEAEDAATDGH